MEYLNARLYRDRYRELIGSAPIFGERPPEPELIACPRCGLEYIANRAPYEEDWSDETDEWAALVRLDEECPDHAHRFTSS